MRLARTGVLPLMILICGCIFLLFPRQWLITTTGDPGECHLTHVYLPVWCHLLVFSLSSPIGLARSSLSCLFSQVRGSGFFLPLVTPERVIFLYSALSARAMLPYPVLYDECPFPLRGSIYS